MKRWCLVVWAAAAMSGVTPVLAAGESDSLSIEAVADRDGPLVVREPGVGVAGRTAEPGAVVYSERSVGFESAVLTAPFEAVVTEDKVPFKLEDGAVLEDALYVSGDKHYCSYIIVRESDEFIEYPCFYDSDDDGRLDRFRLMHESGDRDNIVLAWTVDMEIEPVGYTVEPFFPDRGSPLEVRVTYLGAAEGIAKFQLQIIAASEEPATAQYIEKAKAFHPGEFNADTAADGSFELKLMHPALLAMADGSNKPGYDTQQMIIQGDVREDGSVDYQVTQPLGLWYARVTTVVGEIMLASDFWTKEGSFGMFVR